MILLIRANHANSFELQNYAPLAKKLDIHVVTSRHPLTPIALPHTKLWSPTDLPTFPYRRQILNRLIGGEQWLIELEKLVKKSNGSNHRTILHTAETYTPYTHQAVQLRKRGVIQKLVCTCWETIPHNNEKFRRLRNWKKEAYKYVDLFHTPTNRAKEALITEGVDPQKITVIPYGIDLTHFHPPRIKSKHKKPVVLMVARPVAEKGIDIFHQLESEFKDVAEFRLISNTSYSEMPTIYRSADIFLLPSLTTPTWEEQYGMSLIEAMASGLPIVTTRSGAIPEVVGSAALLAAPNDIRTLSAHLSALISSPTLRAKYSRLALTRAKKLYDSDKIALQLARLYD
ncbi:MAG: glycosyltransferase family 4 protein [bacterium]